MQNFRTYDLALELHRQVQKECAVRGVKGELFDQVKRASMSVVLNVSEGSGRLTSKDRRRFYSIALGSLREVQACCDLMDMPVTDNVHQLAGKIRWLLVSPDPEPGTLAACLTRAARCRK